MHDDIHAHIQRIAENGGAEGVVDIDLGAVGMGDLTHSFDILQFKKHGGGAFQDHQAGLVGDGFLKVGNLNTSDIGQGGAQVGGAVILHKGLQRSVGIADADDVITGLHHAEDRGGCSSHAGTEGEGRHAMLQGSHLVFQDPDRGILHPAVDIGMLVVNLCVEVVVDLVEHVQGVHEDRGNNGIVVLFVFFTIVGSDHFGTAQVKFLIHILHPFSAQAAAGTGLGDRVIPKIRYHKFAVSVKISGHQIHESNLAKRQL